MVADHAEAVRLEAWGQGDHSLLARLVGDPVMMEHLGGPESEAKIAERQPGYEQPGSRGQRPIQRRVRRGRI